MPGALRRGRPRTAWMDNISRLTGLPVEESMRMAEINGESTYITLHYVHRTSTPHSWFINCTVLFIVVNGVSLYVITDACKAIY